MSELKEGFIFLYTWVKLEGFDTKVEKGKGGGVAFYPIFLGCFI
jgi:hypothetical protein